MHVVVMNVFRRVLSVHKVLISAASVGNVFPTSFGLVSVEHVRTILPSEPSPHSLGEVPNFVRGFLVEPVSHGALEAVSVSEDLLGHLVLESGEHIIEWEGVSRHVNPAGFRCENGKSLTGPQTVA